MKSDKAVKILAFFALFLSSVSARCNNVQDGTFLPHPDSNHKWILCWEGDEIEGTCEDDLIFNPFFQECEAEVTCDGAQNGVNLQFAKISVKF